jgi:dGTPase|tara:strand:+ start:117 stop:1484 length:1368 start_codon:yes stop_codon:yes gene_type:complete
MKTTTRTLAELLSPHRSSTAHRDDYTCLDGQHRSPFETDGDKISFTEGFRALADKTQVHDRVQISGTHRNRLTHSMEVARVGRSLGVAVGARMIGYYGLHAEPLGEAFWRVDPADIGHSVAASCLAHDLGNPPFGHDGEDTISAFFSNTDLGARACEMAGAEVGAELRLHEGNAQGFRMITRSMGWRQDGGLNLTAATLAAFGKYPFPLKEGAKKYGIHRADMKTMAFVAEMTRMAPDGEGWLRHPLAWLMEAADDICYLTVDLEDAAWIGMVDIDDLCDLYGPIIGLAEVDRGRAMDNTPRMIQYFRSRMIKTLINGCVEIYAEIAPQIDEGTLPKTAHGGGIVAHSRHAEQMAKIRDYSRTQIYHSSITQEARGRFRSAMHKAMGHLVGDLIDHLEENAGTVYADSARFPALARLPHARLGAEIPADPSAAFPWLMDQVTLLSDAQVMDISRM